MMRCAGPRRLAALAVGLALIGAVPAQAHDASAYGGVFRSRNTGGTWLSTDAGLFLNSALTVAVDPRDPAHLLLGTDTGLLRSLNGGRSWRPEAKDAIIGAVFAAAFAPDGGVVVCGATNGVFRFHRGRWERASAPPGATPVRTIAFGAKTGRVYLLGQGLLFASDDQGRSFVPLHTLTRDGAKVTALAVSVSPTETLFALADGALLASVDSGSHWEKRGASAGPLETILYDQAPSGRLWATARGTLVASDDLGWHWRMMGRLPEPNIVVRGIAADAAHVIVTSDRGMYDSIDGGQTWRTRGKRPSSPYRGGTADPRSKRPADVVRRLFPHAVWASVACRT